MFSFSSRCSSHPNGLLAGGGSFLAEAFLEGAQTRLAFLALAERSTPDAPVEIVRALALKIGRAIGIF